MLKINLLTKVYTQQQNANHLKTKVLYFSGFVDVGRA